MSASPHMPKLHSGDLAPVVEYLQSMLGARFDGNRGAHLLTAIKQAVSRSGACSITAYLARIRQDPAVREDLLAAITVGETYFFRHPEQLDILTQRVIPELLSQRPPRHRWKLWSAGCATGEEAYTLAMLAGQSGLATAQVLGTDVSRAALRRAAAATYGRRALRGEQRDANPLQVVGDRLQVPQRIVERVELRPLNLLHDAYPQDMDVILCRNVLMYLTRAHIRTVVMRLAEALAPGGWLITAPADPDIGSSGVLERVMTPAGVMYRRGQGDPRRPVRASSVVSASTAAPADPPPVSHAPAVTAAGAADALERGDRAGAAAAAQDVIAAGDDSPQMRIVWARALGDAGDVVQAEAVAAAGVEAFPVNAALRSLHAELLLENGRPGAAATAASAAVYLDPALGPAYLILGRAELARGRDETARRAFHQAGQLLRTGPGEPERSDGGLAGYAAAYKQLAAQGPNRP